MATRIRLSKPCPLKAYPEFDASGNYACDHCQKNVHDFTRNDEQAVKAVLSDPAFDSCGSYRQRYYAGRLGRWQTRLLDKKERMSRQHGIGRKWAVFPLLLLLTFLMGCRTVQGKIKGSGYFEKPTPAPTEKKKNLSQ